MSIGADHLIAERDRAACVGRDLESPVGVTHFFSSPGREPIELSRALRDMAITDVLVSEEISGDEFWHVTAFAELMLVSSVVREVEEKMEQIARALDARYDGWKVTLTVAEEKEIKES